MAENTKIEWAHHTFNPWIGCTKVGPGCDNCYAEADFDKRRHVVKWGGGKPRKLTAPSTWAQPLRWNKMAAAEGVRYRVFCASLADVFDNEVNPHWREGLFELIAATPNLDWLLLTKRIGNVGNMLPVPFDFARLYPNVWIGATITSQAEADRDIPKLLAVNAAKRFLSMEPLLGPVDLTLDSLVCNPCLLCTDQSADPDTGAVEHCRHCEWTGKGGEWGIDWVIVGGESGTNARPMHPDWARSLRDQCHSAGVPFLFKQWGEWVPANSGDFCRSATAPEHADFRLKHGRGGYEFAGKIGRSILNDGRTCIEQPAGTTWSRPAGSWVDAGAKETFKRFLETGKPDIGYQWMFCVGKKAAGRLLDGREWSEVPAC